MFSADAVLWHLVDTNDLCTEVIIILTNNSPMFDSDGLMLCSNNFSGDGSRYAMI